MRKAIFNINAAPVYIKDEKLVALRLKGFSDFISLRWNGSLPQEKGLTLLPVRASQEFFRSFNPKLIKLLKLCRARVRELALEKGAQAVEELYGLGEFPLELLQMEFLQKKASPLLARPDVVIQKNGNAKILETNLGSGFAGLFWCEQLHGFYHSEPSLKEWVEKNKLKIPAPTMGAAMLSDRMRIKNLAIVDTGLPYMFSQAMAEYMNRYRKSGKTFYALHSELDITNSGVYLDGHRIDWIYPNILPHYFTAPYLRKIWSAVKAGTLRSLSGFWDSLSSSKATLSLLYKEALSGRLSHAEARLVIDLVPPTFTLREQKINDGEKSKDFWEFCVEKQHQLIAKRACGEQARDLLIGRSTPARDWENFIHARAKDPSEIWVIQEYVEHPEASNYFLSETGSVEKFSAPFHVCPFVFETVTSLGVRFGFDAKQERPLVAPDDLSCSINLLALEK